MYLILINILHKEKCYFYGKLYLFGYNNNKNVSVNLIDINFEEKYF